MSTVTSEQTVNTANGTINNIGVENSGSQYLTFALAGESYGVDILRVQEIKGWTTVTRIPNTPHYLQGVLNLRGTIVPIVDMRMRFNLETADYTEITVIIVLSVKNENGDRVIGLVVDSVSDVVSVDPANIKPKPDFGSSVNTDFLNGLATTGDQMVMLLDVDKLMSEDEMTTMAGVSEVAAAMPEVAAQND